MSNCHLDQLARARSVARIVSVQNQYSVADRTHEEVLERCAAQGLAFLPWGASHSTEVELPLIAKSPVEQIAESHGVSTQHVAIGWLLAHSPALLLIPGTSKRTHLEDDLADAMLHLSPGELHRLG